MLSGQASPLWSHHPGAAQALGMLLFPCACFCVPECLLFLGLFPLQMTETDHLTGHVSWGCGTEADKALSSEQLWASEACSGLVPDSAHSLVPSNAQHADGVFDSFSSKV